MMVSLGRDADSPSVRRSLRLELTPRPTPARRSSTVVVQRRHDDDQPVELEIASADKMVLSTDLQRHTWNRLIEDFIGAVRNDDKDHGSYPSVPTLTDGLPTEKVIDAARQSSSTGRWGTVGG
jgi:predicted dehydrogenase